MRLIRITLTAVLLLALGGCSLLSSSLSSGRSSRPVQAQTDSRNVQRWQDLYDPKTSPYTVLGRTYYPLQDARGYSEVGVASWYGDDFHGKKTASGDVYDMYAISAAHKTLPLGTVVRVTNLQNGSQVDLLINDRGPFVDGRIIDLSLGAARQLGSARAGVVKVRVTAIGSYSAPSSYLASNSRQSQSSPRAASAPPSQVQQAASGYYIRVGTFAVEENALRLRDRLVQDGFPGSRIRTVIQNGREVHVVQAGVFRDMDQARTALIQLRTEFPGSFIDS